MATKQIGTLAVGSIVKLKVNGSLREFLVVQQGRPSSLYETTCDGTWLLMKDIYENRQWHSSDVNNYANSTIHSYLNSTFLNLIDSNIRNQIKQVKIPYRQNGGSGGTDCSRENGLSCKIFLLSGYECGFTTSDSEHFPLDGVRLAYFESGTGTNANNKRIAKLNGNATNWWLRSPRTANTNHAWDIRNVGDCLYWMVSTAYGIRPALILPPSFQVMTCTDGTFTTNTAPSTPSSITIPDTINGGSTVTVSWGTSSDAEGNLSGYKVERSTNGGSTWSQIYQGSARQTTDNVAFGTESVMYRVQAYDAEGLHSGYRSSAQVTVLNNHAPGAPAGITVPEEVKGGGALAVTWQAATDPDGDALTYSLERQHDSGAWAVIYSGSALTYTDSVTKGWQTVAYRVRAKDVHDAYGSYATSDTREVDNNTAPTVTCALSGNLGIKSEGFSVPYAVADPDEGDTVTVTEIMDSKTVRTLQGTGEQSFSLTGAAWMKVLNGSHTVKLTASDGKAESVHTLTFTKAVTKAVVTLAEPMEADAQITICVLSVTGFIPKDAKFKMEVTNNGNDETPVWQDCTAAVQAGANILLENETAANGFAFNFRLSVERGPSGQGGYITSIQGGFQ